MSTRTIKVTVNGVTRERSVEPRLLLVDFLRHTLGNALPSLLLFWILW